MLSLDIPQRDIDTGQGGNAEAALALVAQGIVKHSPDLFGLAGILANKPTGIGLNHGGVRSRRTEAFAPADGPVIAFDFDQNMGTPVKAHGCAFKRRTQPMFEQMRAHRCDLHRSPPVIP
ncbi:hypothetical protein D3C71_1869060 [compost metagenome]